MKCPKCFKEGCKYIKRKKEEFTRAGGHNDSKLVKSSPKARCKKCGWEGDL